MSDGLALFTFVHVLLGVMGIASGAIVVGGFLLGKRLELLASLFLASTLGTSLTGFLFPFDRLMPSHVVGVVSVCVLAGAYATRGGTSMKLRRVFMICALAALYLNMLVLVAQAFMKISPPRALAPTQTEFPFLCAQAGLLLGFIGLGIGCINRSKCGAGVNQKKRNQRTHGPADSI